MIRNFITSVRYAMNAEDDDQEIIEAYRDNPIDFFEIFASTTFFKCLLAAGLFVASITDFYRGFIRDGSLSAMGWDGVLSPLAGAAIALFFFYFEPRSFRIVRQFMMVPHDRALNIKVYRKYEKSEARVKELEASKASDAEELAILRETYVAEHQGWQDAVTREELRNDKLEKELREMTSREKAAIEEFDKQKHDNKGILSDLDLHIRKIEAENRELRSAKEEIRHQSLEGFGLDNIVGFLNFKLANDFSDPLPEKDVAVLYGLLQEHVPDKERMKEISLVPHEILRARQIERVVEHYSQMITEVENSGLSETEKRNKINAYRLARERELGIEE